MFEVLKLNINFGYLLMYFQAKTKERIFWEKLLNCLEDEECTCHACHRLCQIPCKMINVQSVLQYPVKYIDNALINYRTLYHIYCRSQYDLRSTLDIVKIEEY